MQLQDADVWQIQDARALSGQALPSEEFPPLCILQENTRSPADLRAERTRESPVP